MNARAKTIVLAFSLVSLLAAPFAEAARMGKGRSYGMRRAAPTQSYQQRPAQAPAPAQAPQQPQKRGVGVGTAVAAGAVGAAAGYMLGSSMNNGHPATASAAAAAPASAPVAEVPAQAPQPAIPWRLIALLAVLFVGGLWWFRRRVGMPNGAPARMQAPAPQALDPRFDPIPQIGSGFPGSSAPQTQTMGTGLRRLPDGTETPYFLRQAKATFLHLQSLNSPDSLDEVRRYMTPELFEELRGEIANNSEVADFTQLDCQLLDASEENGRYIASVRFDGLVSESVNASPIPFAETWNFIKTAGTSDKWMVAGIQQNG